MKGAQHVFSVLAAVAVLQCAIYYPQLPATVASHFGASGHPNGWSPKGVFFAIVFGMILLNVLVFVLLPPRLPRLSRGGLNLPNKGYWLAPERHEATESSVRTRITWFGVAQMALLVMTVQFVITANMRPEPRLGAGMGWLMAAYFGFVAGWIFHFFRRFARREPSPRT